MTKNGMKISLKQSKVTKTARRTKKQLKKMSKNAKKMVKKTKKVPKMAENGHVVLLCINLHRNPTFGVKKSCTILHRRESPFVVEGTWLRWPVQSHNRPRVLLPPAEEGTPFILCWVRTGSDSGSIS